MGTIRLFEAVHYKVNQWIIALDVKIETRAPVLSVNRGVSG